MSAYDCKCWIADYGCPCRDRYEAEQEALEEAAEALLAQMNEERVTRATRATTPLRMEVGQ